MADAFRFYWRERETGISMAEIPECDRNPLRVRRGVVLAAAPDVLRQLEAGHFVAAAWESGGSILLTLCHPYLATVPDQSVLVDDAALPRVALKLAAWDDVPEASKLLLAALGTEGSSTEHRAAARRRLAKWLSEIDQPEPAAALQRLFAFSYGGRTDTLDVIDAWRHLLINGEKTALDTVTDELESRLNSLGWARDSVLEGDLNRPELQRNRFCCWASSSDNGPRVLVCLNRATERRVRGGTYGIDQSASLADLASAIQYVLIELLEPAASAVGLKVAYPHLGSISRVGNRTAAAMTALAESADGRWPWSRSDQLERVWRTFVVTALREDAALHPEELTAWFIASGWEGPAAAELTQKFYDEAEFLAEYEEAGRQPA
jgi:hypothetical protein